MITIFLFILFILLSAYLALHKPSFFVLYYFFVSTKLFGFFSVEEFFIIGGLGLGFFSLNLITLFVAILKKPIVKINKKSRRFSIFLSAVMLYGVFFPVIQETSSFLPSLIASKDFWTIAFFIYLIKHSGSLNLEKILKVILVVGLYLSIIYIVFLLTNLAPPHYLGFKESIGIYARVSFPTYISLSVFIATYFHYSQKPLFLNYYLIIFVLFIGILLAGHTALLAGTSVCFLLFLIIKDIKRNILPLVFKLSLGLIFITISVFTFQKEIEHLNKITYNDADNALTSRERYNEFRWEAIEKQPFMGYGFLHKDAAYSNRLLPDSESAYMQRLETIDSGYVDLLVKFGFIGMFIYLISWFKIIILPFLKIELYGNLGIVMACFLLQYFFVNYTWSVFSFSHGLIPGFLALFILLHIKQFTPDENYIK